MTELIKAQLCFNRHKEKDTFWSVDTVNLDTVHTKNTMHKKLQSLGGKVKNCQRAEK
jgi:hypothetical protein